MNNINKNNYFYKKLVEPKFNPKNKWLEKAYTMQQM